MHTCQSIGELLPLFVNGRSTQEQRERIAAHLAACGKCLDELGLLFRLRDGFMAHASSCLPKSDRLDRVFEAVVSHGAAAVSPNSDVLVRVRPLAWMQDLVAYAERLRSRGWGIRVGPVVIPMSKA